MPIDIPPATQAFFRTLKNPADVAVLLGTSFKRLSHYLYPNPGPYNSFVIPKASGGTRQILSPTEPLATFQRILLACISAIYCPMPEVHGFTTKRSVITNAKPHVRRPLVLNLDLENFFPSINYGRVYGLFKSKPFSFPPKVAAVLAQICCYRGYLPQGAPTSPIVSNLICRSLDKQLRSLARVHHCRYTRYGDDLTFSSQGSSITTELVKNPYAHPPELSDRIHQIIQANGFVVNANKTRLRGKRDRREVTGIITNEHLNVPRTYVRNLRAALHCWKCNGERDAEAKFQANYDTHYRRRSAPDIRSHLRGKLDYLAMVRGKRDPVYCRLALSYAELSQTAPVIISGSLCMLPKFMEAALWIILGLDRNGAEVRVATAFSLEGYGVITCAHTFEAGDEDGICRWVVIHASRPSRRYALTKVTLASHHDLALFAEPSFSPGRISYGDSTTVTVGQEIHLVGFPHWSSAAHQVRMERGQITSMKTASMVRHFMISASVLSGNSGGPLLDFDGTVIGIARYDASNHIVPNSVVASENLRELRGAYAKELIL